MSQFDVYLNPNSKTRSSVPYFLDIQNDLLDVLATRVIVPLVAKSRLRKPARHLNPGFIIEGKTVYMSTAEMAGISRGAIGKYVCTLSEKRFEIISALDFLITGI